MADLIEFDTLKALLDLEKSALSEYPALEAIVSAVPATLEQYTGRNFVEEDSYEESGYIPAGMPSRFIYLANSPLISITSITVDDLDYTSIPYTMMGDGIRLKTPIEDAEWTVAYTGGFAEGFPADLRYAAAVQAMYEFQNREHLGAQTVSTEGGSVTTPGFKLHAEVVRRLRPYMSPGAVGVG